MIRFSDVEKDILKIWKEEKTLEKTDQKDSPRGEFVFYDGPPTANGKPGIHHVLARAFKDVMLRFKTMQGYRVIRKAGWDTHGLPVEIAVEKELGISGKKDIENLVLGDKSASIAKFNQLCKESVWKFKSDWEVMTERMGYWVDMEHPYITYENEYIESLWSIVSEINKKGYLYKGFKVVPYCPKDQVTLSSHEVAQGYKDVFDEAVYVKFKVLSSLSPEVKQGDFLLAWTTTPWTLPGNVALAVGEDVTYVKIQLKNGDNLIFAKNLIETILKDEEYEVLSEFSGKDLLGIKYDPLYKTVDCKGSEQSYVVLPASFVTTTDGTGIVHTAVVYGEDDYQLGKQFGLPEYHTVDTAGNFDLKLFDSDDQKDFINQINKRFVKEDGLEKEFITNLESRGLLLKHEAYKHTYPYCWRCGTPLIYYAKPSWFIRMSELSGELVKQNTKINWIPEHIKEGRFGEWLEGVKDWAISRERYWGTPLPVWECEDKHINVMGSVKTLKEKSLTSVSDSLDLHKPFVDDVIIKCDTCGKEAHRVPEVMDCWFDSGGMPYAQHHHVFGESKEIKEYPAEYICEAIDQTRGWFYTLLAISTLLGLPSPYKNVICLGHINDKHGKKMSKSKGNIIDPETIFEKYGADATRLYMFTMNQPGDAKNFDEKGVDLIVKKMFLLWLNVIVYYETYKSDGGVVAGTKNPLDIWIVAKLNNLIEDVRVNMESYDIFKASRALMDFVDGLSTWYIRRSRDRNKIMDDDQKAFSATLRHILTELAKVAAPFVPFVSEYMYRRLGYTESVHMQSWPTQIVVSGTKDVEKTMDEARRIIELGLALRNDAGIKIRQPLSKLFVQKEISDEYRNIIADELNVEGVVFAESIKEKDGVVVKQEGNTIVGLDIEITQELKIKGISREITRKINDYRKQLGLTIHDVVDIYYSTKSEDIKKALETYNKELSVDTRSRTLVFGEEGDNPSDLDINGEVCTVRVKKT